MCDLGVRGGWGVSSGGVFRQLRGQPRSARRGRRQAGVQAAAPPPPGAAEAPLMPAPGAGAQGWAAGAAGVAAGASSEAVMWWGGRAGRPDTSPPRPPAGRRRPRSRWA